MSGSREPSSRMIRNDQRFPMMSGEMLTGHADRRDIDFPGTF